MTEDERVIARAKVQDAMERLNVLRPSLRRVSAGYGRKGGTSATAGKKATTFLIDMPDGSTKRKRSYFVHDETALAPVFEHDGVWHTTGIYPVGEPLHPNFNRNHTILTARRAA
jgi:hypothetical protein